MSGNCSITAENFKICGQTFPWITKGRDGSSCVYSSVNFLKEDIRSQVHNIVCVQKWFGIFSKVVAVSYVTFGSERQKLVDNCIQGGPTDFIILSFIISYLFYFI